MSNIEAFINQAETELDPIKGIITTFDGIEHDKEELLIKMIDDDFYYDYLGKEALSSSSLKNILKSPKIYKEILDNGQNETQALRSGKLFHWMILEPKKAANLHIVEVASKNTKAYKEAVANHENVFTRREVDDMERLVKVFKKNEKAMELLDGAEVEVPEIKMIKGIPFRGKADILRVDELIDIKTTTDIGNFKYSAYKYGYDLQAYLYLKLFPQAKSFKFLCIDKATKDLAIYECSEEFLESGRQKLEKGISDYRKFFQNNEDLDQYIINGTV
jgi:exodeoxyribonuclease VIII